MNWVLLLHVDGSPMFVSGRTRKNIVVLLLLLLKKMMMLILNGGQ